MIDRVRVRYNTLPNGSAKNVTDTKNVIHHPIGQVKLRWNKKGKAKSFDETFYVVDKPTPFVILGESAFPHTKELAGAPAYPVGVKAQTAGKSIDFLHGQ